MNSIQGLWISMALLAGDMPLVPAAAALYAKLGRVSALRAFNAITGILILLGTAHAFLMAWQLTRTERNFKFCRAHSALTLLGWMVYTVIALFVNQGEVTTRFTPKWRQCGPRFAFTPN